jgi:NTE family protein
MLRLADFGLRGGLIKGARINEVFREQFVECDFSELSIPFAAVATDLHSGQEIWCEGSVSAAIAASIAVPGLFRPVQHEDRYLVDGSVVNPIPVSLCRAMGADIVLAVDLGTDLVGSYVGDDDRAPTRTSPRGLISKILPRFNRSAEKDAEPEAPALLETFYGRDQHRAAADRSKPTRGRAADVLITPPRPPWTARLSSRAEPAIAEGRAAIVRMLPAIRNAIPA